MRSLEIQREAFFKQNTSHVCTSWGTFLRLFFARTRICWEQIMNALPKNCMWGRLGMKDKVDAVI